MSEVPATATLAAFLADFFLQPLRYLPTWMPCGSWKKDILVLNKDLDAMRYVHSKFVKEQIARSYVASFTSKHLDGDLNMTRGQLAKDAAFSFYADFPYVTKEDDVRAEYSYIREPKILRDPDTYTDPFKLKPDRFVLTERRVTEQDPCMVAV
ncbi:hypothetical protein POSPLADRAFT_1032448 [Postia placenta MAD-698-R-SB12]|uniref:Uncharacterized protein n=1 Tax=Postia placenta MAD-698-R-SB12 TaxID=670580 RepID=A0A1X6N5Q9_9APHY|nr:hypothetical protein POSPLADRAFT_1032448 [Postia placenta MAD-698-R-SB12]OSX63944.1 hypothetical protein POSPLADRAFT_1032448 [Postia placenta MAD-698-R-SB12]